MSFPLESFSSHSTVTVRDGYSVSTGMMEEYVYAVLAFRGQVSPLPAVLHASGSGSGKGMGILAMMPWTMDVAVVTSSGPVMKSNTMVALVPFLMGQTGVVSQPVTLTFFRVPAPPQAIQLIAQLCATNTVAKSMQNVKNCILVFLEFEGG